MRHTLILLSLAISLGACGLFKKHKTKTKTDHVRTSDSAATVIVTVKEKADTVIVITGTTVSGEKPAESILKGDSLVVDNGGIRVVVKADPVTGSLKATATTRDRAVPISISKETTTASRVHVKRTDELHTKTKDKEKSRTVNPVNAVIFALIFLLLVLALLRYIHRRSLGKSFF